MEQTAGRAFILNLLMNPLYEVLYGVLNYLLLPSCLTLTSSMRQTDRDGFRCPDCLPGTRLGTEVRTYEEDHRLLIVRASPQQPWLPISHHVILALPG